MNKEEILNGNILIAKFMDGICSNYADKTKGWIIPNLTVNGVEGDENNLKFHSDWNWIMPVVDKIKEMKHPIYLYQSHVQSTVEIFQMKNDHYIVRESDTLSKPIEVLFRALVQFIKFYNKDKK